MRRATFHLAPVLGLASLLLFSCTSAGESAGHTPTIRREALSTGASAPAATFRLDSLLARTSDLLPSAEAGVAIGVIDGGDSLLAFVGNSDFDAATLFEFASITKVVTSALLVELAAEGVVSLDESINSYLGPDVRESKWDGVSLLRLATHTAGLSGLPPNLRPAFVWLRGQADDPFAAYDRSDLEAGMKRARADGGETWRYSNFGYAVLGMVLENASGSSYRELVWTRVLSPLGMVGATISGWSSAQIAPPLNARGRPGSNWSFDAMAPIGALRGTIEDGLLLLQASMDACESDDPLSRALCRAQQTTGVRAGALGEMGIGWMRSERDGVDVVWHNGGTGGYSTFLGFAPAKERGVVILSNVSGLREIDPLAMELLAAP